MGFIRNLGGMELMVICGIALLFFGPSQLPKLGRSIGETFKSFRQSGREIRAAMNDEDDEK